MLDCAHRRVIAPIFSGRAHWAVALISGASEGMGLGVYGNEIGAVCVFKEAVAKNCVLSQVLENASSSYCLIP
jgi:hypothetical protein